MIDQFSRLPGIGPKTAERLVFFLLEQPDTVIFDFNNALNNLKINVVRCDICRNIAAKNPCEICSDFGRDKSQICVVAKSQDIAAIEKTNAYKGLYHVLGGMLNPIQGVRMDNLNVKNLGERMKEGNIREIILALNPDIEGETTALALIKFIRNISPKIKITRLARGLPMGSDLEYADEVTLSSALSGRREV